MNFLGEAFKRLNTLQEDTFDITDTDIAELEDAVVGTDEDETIDIIDDEVETFEELQPSYVGKVILDCNVCHSLVYKDKADVVLSDDGEDANLSDECPYCMSTDGFKVVGEVAPFAEKAEEEIEVKVDDEPVEVGADEEAEVEENSDLEEGYRRIRRKALRESTRNRKINKRSNSKRLAESKKSSRRRKLNESFFDIEVDDNYVELETYVDDNGNKMLFISSDNSTGAEYPYETSQDVGKLVSEYLYNYEDLDFDEGKTIYISSENGTGEEGQYESLEDLAEFVTAYISDMDESLEKCPNCGKDKKHYKCEKELEECGNPINEDMTRIPLAKYDPRFGDEYTIDSSGNVYKDGKLRKWRPGSSQWDGKLDAVTKKGMKTTIAQQKLRDFVVDNPRLFEGFEDVSITTEDQHMEMSADENGKITVTTEPVENEVETEDEAEDEMIVPVDDELEADIEAGPEEEEALVDGEEFEDEFVADEDGDVEVDLEDIDEESLDDVTESYLREVYENVNSFRTTSVTQKGNTLKVEGVINFKSGKNRKTSFLFEAKNITKRGKVKLVGMNESITRGKKPYTITGTISDKKLVVESFNYNYRQKDEKGNSVRLYNTCKRSK